jgi:hypothetical protein
MGKPIFAVAVPVPNGDAQYKSDGNGQFAGVPDGWRTSTQWNTDVTGVKLKTLWEPMRRGDSVYPGAALHSGNGRAFGARLLNTATNVTTRYAESPPSLPGSMWGAEANDPLGTTNDFWWLRVRCWFRGAGIAPTGLGNWYLYVVGYVDAAETSSTVLCLIGFSPSTDWGVGWIQKLSTPFMVNSSIHHVRLRFIPAAGALTAGYAEGSFASPTVETLGPADAVSAAGTGDILNQTLAAEGNGGTYYQLTRAHVYAGFKTDIQRLGKLTRTVTGSSRWYDPTGGAVKRKFTVPLDLAVRTDYEKLYRLWMVNKGYSQETASYYGTPMPLIFSPQSADDPGFYVVNFDGDTFPLVPGGGFMPGTEAGQMYKGTVVLVEV